MSVRLSFVWITFAIAGHLKFVSLCLRAKMRKDPSTDTRPVPSICGLSNNKIVHLLCFLDCVFLLYFSFMFKRALKLQLPQFLLVVSHDVHMGLGTTGNALVIRATRQSTKQRTRSELSILCTVTLLLILYSITTNGQGQMYYSWCQPLYPPFPYRPGKLFTLCCVTLCLCILAVLWSYSSIYGKTNRNYKMMYNCIDLMELVLQWLMNAHILGYAVSTYLPEV